MNALLLFVKSLFRKIGIEISFVKKDSGVCYQNHNTEEGMDAFWENQKNEKYWKKPELMKFYGKVIDTVKQNGFVLDQKDILDAGCGTGSLLIFLNEVFKPSSNYGYEFSKKALEIANKRFPNATYEYKNLNESSEAKFDFIFCTEVLEHILNPQIPLQNLINTIKPGGGLLVTVPNGRTDTYEGHVNFWSPESWDAFIKNNVGERKYIVGEYQNHGLYSLIWH